MYFSRMIWRIKFINNAFSYSLLFSKSVTKSNTPLVWDCLLSAIIKDSHTTLASLIIFVAVFLNINCSWCYFNVWEHWRQFWLLVLIHSRGSRQKTTLKKVPHFSNTTLAQNNPHDIHVTWRSQFYSTINNSH